MLNNSVEGAFPPNTLFRFVKEMAPGEWEGPGGVRPMQRLLLVTATYRRASDREAEAVRLRAVCAVRAFEILELGVRRLNLALMVRERDGASRGPRVFRRRPARVPRRPGRRRTGPCGDGGR